MSNRTKAYYVFTVLTGLGLIASGIANATVQPPIEESMTTLGYPMYFPRIIGVWKVLAGIAILAPRFPRLKEWAYAGVFFNMTGATISHVAVSDPVATWFPPLVVLAIAMASWALRPDDRRLS